MKKHEWRPRLRMGQVSIRREGNLFAVVCRNKKEAETVLEYLVKALSRARRGNGIS